MVVQCLNICNDARVGGVFSVDWPLSPCFFSSFCCITIDIKSILYIIYEWMKAKRGRKLKRPCVHYTLTEIRAAYHRTHAN